MRLLIQFLTLRFIIHVGWDDPLTSERIRTLKPCVPMRAPAKEFVVAHPVRSMRDQDLQEQPDAADRRLALALLDEGRASEAVEIARQGLSAHPRDPQLLLLLGRGLVLQGDFAEARRALLEGTLVAPSDAQLCAWLARALLGLGESYRAVRMLQRAIQLGALDDQVAELYARAHLAWEEKKTTPHVVARRSSRPPPPSVEEVELLEAPADEGNWETLLKQAKNRS